MANEQNLKTLSPNEAREFGRIGGIASGQSRREQKQIREIAKVISGIPAKDLLPKHTFCVFDTGNTFCGLKDPNVIQAVIAKIASSALKGNIAAAKLFLELSGALPKSQSVNIVSCQTTQDAMQVIYGHTKQEVMDT